jgi:hypothetical protein
MAEKPQPLCDACHERPATHHICCVGLSKEVIRDLCSECYQQTATPEALAIDGRFKEIIRTGKCDYCGAPAFTGSYSSCSVPGDGKENIHLKCKQCADHLREFHSLPGNKIDSDFDPEDEESMARISKQFAEMETREKEFMRLKLKNRGLE